MAALRNAREGLTGAPTRIARPSLQARYVALGMKLFNIRRRLDDLERQNMARVTWRGETFTAKPIRQNPDGSWVMQAMAHTARTAPGTIITVLPKEIVAGTLEDTTQGAPDSGQAALDAGMAEERKTLASPAELIAQFQGNTKQGDAGAVAPGPTQAPVAAPATPSQGKTSMPHLADKMKLFATGAQGFAAKLEALIDQKMTEQNTAQEQILNSVTISFATVDAVIADADAGAQAIQAAVKDLTNQ